MNMNRQIIQIAVAGTIENSMTQAEALIVALCNDGTVWSTTNRNSDWMKFPSIPQDHDINEIGCDQDS